jgi:threonyl-tRNA synthetase
MPLASSACANAASARSHTSSEPTRFSGRVESLMSTFSKPKCLYAQFIAEDGSKQTPVMLHRAIVGSLERFIGILIEHYEGAFPSWLAPIQAVILNISEKQADFVTDVEKKLKKQGLRVISDLRNEKIGFKIREHSMQRFPYLLVIGDREMENKQVSVRRRGGEDLGPMSIDAFVDLINQE